MRIIIAAAAGIIGAGLLAPSAHAAPAPGKDPAAIQHIVPVANGCGVGWHWVPGYRRYDGVWIPGRCVPNRY